MKKIPHIVGTVAMIFLVIAMLLTSFQIAIYGDKDYKFYQREYEKYNVTESLGMEMDNVMYVTHEMMAYLIGDREELSVVTMVEGEEKDFFNEQDRFHMWEVQGLFLGGLKIRNICLVVMILLLAFLKWKKVKLTDILPVAYGIALAVFGGLTAILGVLISQDFNRYFTIFHEIFFDNDLWIFDERTDYMIRMLPEGFFFDFVMRIGTIFVAMLLVAGGAAVITKIWKKRATNK